MVVADDGSGVDTVRKLVAMMSAYPFPIVHAWHPKDGFRLSAARNNGIRRSRGEYLVFLDCDFAVLPGTIPTDINRDILAGVGVTDAIVAATPLKSLGTCEDIASAVLYMAGLPLEANVQFLTVMATKMPYIGRG